MTQQGLVQRQENLALPFHLNHPVTTEDTNDTERVEYP